MIETARLRLRPMVAGDAEPLLALFGDARFMAAFDAAPFDRAAMDRWVARNLAHQREHGYGLFAIERRSDGAVVGDCGLEHVEIGVELGYDLHPDLWGHGYATEAAAAVRDFAFGELGTERLISLIRVGNERSRRVAEKIGMHPGREIERGRARYWLYELVKAASPRPSA